MAMHTCALLLLASASVAFAKYHIRLNVHVFNNLILVCNSLNDLPRAFQVVERMLRERVRLDARSE